MVIKLRKTVYFPNVPALVNLLESWLQNKALLGWRLEHSFGWKFTFYQCKPYKTSYFIYSRLDKSSGFSSSYYSAKNKYSRKNSILNNFRIFEVDINKIDSDFDFYVISRNQNYFKHYLTMFFIYLFGTIVMARMVKYAPILKVVVLIGIVYMFYSLTSASILLFESKRVKYNVKKR